MAILMLKVLLICLFQMAIGHNWLACTDYTEKNAGTWKPYKCRGFARGSHRQAPKSGEFGKDRNFDHKPEERNPCQLPKNDKTQYTRDHPMAVYYPGQQVILVHPMKNHGADAKCSNIYIPDTGNWIYRSERNVTEEPRLSEFRKNMVFDLGKSPTGEDFEGRFELSSIYPKPGFQNAPRFCSNQDKAVATFAFNVPKDLEPGKYTFMWLWAFNSMKDLYSSCFEVQIAANKVARNKALLRKGFKDISEPCGGMTSNPNIKGNRNPGCKNVPFRAYAKLPKKPTPATTTTQSFTQAAANTSEDILQSVNTNTYLSSPLITGLTGDIPVPAPRSTAVRRYFSLEFGCDVITAKFFNSVLLTEKKSWMPPIKRNRQYIVMQEGEKQLSQGFLKFHVVTKRCHLTKLTPKTFLLREEYRKE